MKWFAETQRQQITINKEYAISLRAEKTAREAEAAIRGRGVRKGKKKETQAGRKARGEVAATTRSTRIRTRVESITQLVLSPKKKKKKT